ncbi:MAG TPA: ATP-binding protein [Candidatus Binataceae bacterium]|nr:ATP-binding protein [Candidatus Binataceae bacterium]
MAASSKRRKSIADFNRRRFRHEDFLQAKIEAIAALAAATIGAEMCAIAWSGAEPNRAIYAPRRDSRWRDTLNALFAALDQCLGELTANSVPARTHSSAQSVSLSARQIEAIVGRVPLNSDEDEEDRVQIAATAFASTGTAVRVALIKTGECRRAELEATLELAGRAALAEIAVENERAAHRFWRERCVDTGTQAAATRRELAMERQVQACLDAAVEKARRFRPYDRMARLGALIGSTAGYDDWVIAIAENGALKTMAASDRINVGSYAVDSGALAECFNRQSMITGSDGEGRAQYPEDQIFRGAFVCIPFEAGAIALGSRGRPKLDARAVAEAIVRRLDPIVRTWAMEEESERSRALIARLGLRMFNAIDEERARIARDLHDDQAQLLAAARIALAGRRAAARAILGQVEDELRRKTRELRPAMLGRARLDEAIRREFDRLSGTGIGAKLAGASAARALPRPAQQLCFQIVREAISNVLRHARARTIEVRIERSKGDVRVTIADDGRGIAAKERRDGAGLAGIRERLELIGGRMAIESGPRGATLMAEIPVPRI